VDIRFIILIIFAVIWVIGNVLRAQQEEPKTPPVRRPPPRPNQNPNPNQNNETAQSNRSPQPVSDIDRFLQEIDRMRRRGAEEAETAKSPPPPKPKPVQQPQQRPPQAKKSPSSTGGTGRQPKQAKLAKQAPRQPREQQQPQAHTPTAQRQPGDLAMELDLAEAKIVEPETPREVEAKFIAAPSQAAGGKAGTSTAGSATQSASTAGTTTSTKFPEKRRSNQPVEGSPAELLKALLKSNKGVTVAFVLAEIFGEPKCKKNAPILPPAPMEETSEAKPA